MERLYKNISELIENYEQCSQNKNWNDFNFPDACELLKTDVNEVLRNSGYQYEEYHFKTSSLELNSPGQGSRNLCYHKNKEPLTKQDISNDVSKYSVVMHSIEDCDELKTRLFHRSNEEYEEAPILYLKDIYDGLCKIASGEDNEFSQTEMIALIGGALKAYPIGDV